MRTNHSTTRPWAALTIGLGLLLLVTATVRAESTIITQILTGGDPPAVTINAASMEPASYATEDQVSQGSLSLTVSAASGTAPGWEVSVEATDLDYEGALDGSAISAANFAVASANAPVHIEGQAIDGDEGPFVPAGATGSLDQPRTVLVANADHGEGIYTQDLDLALTIPGLSRAGSYSGTLIVSISTGP